MKLISVIFAVIVGLCHSYEAYGAPESAELLTIDKTHDCLFSITGYENFTLLPTTTTRYGHPVYQGVDNDTCEGLNRYLHRWYNGYYEWIIDDDTVASAHSSSGGRLGYLNPNFTGCVAETDVLFWHDGGHKNDSKLRKIEKSKCFTPGPVPTELLPIDTSHDCLFSI
eukprot:Lankesteria_metandrocarpae@DN4777_c0_g1_i2.p1